MKLSNVIRVDLWHAVVIVSVFGAAFLCSTHLGHSVTPDPPPCIPQWTPWFITWGKEPALDIQIQGPEWFETCINVEYHGAEGGPITVRATWSKRDGEKQRQDPTGCANPNKQTAPLRVPDPTVTWRAYHGYSLIAEGSGTTASFNFAPLDQPDGGWVEFRAYTEIRDPDIGYLPLFDSCIANIQVWRNILYPTFPGEPRPIEFGHEEYVNELREWVYPCGPPLYGAVSLVENAVGMVTFLIRDKFTYDFTTSGNCGAELTIQRGYPTCWDITFGVSVNWEFLSFGFDIVKSSPIEIQSITVPKSCYKMPYVWVFRRQVDTVSKGKFTGSYYRRVTDCLGRILSEVWAFPKNQDASVLVKPPKNFIGYTVVSVQKDCCPNQVPCP